MLKLSATRKRLFGFIIFGWVLLLISDRIGELRQYQGAFVAMYTLAIASIILLTGYSGQLSLGHSALMAVGAYAGALSVNNFKLHPVIALVMAALVAGIFGLFLGYAAARLSGPYLAGTTLALAVSLPTIANQFPVLGGEQGLAFDIGIAPTRLGEDFSQYQWFFWISCLSALIMIWFLVNLLNSRYGREFRALRDNPTAAQLAGINIGRQKALAFSLSAGIAGLAGTASAATSRCSVVDGDRPVCKCTYICSHKISHGQCPLAVGRCWCSRWHKACPGSNCLYVPDRSITCTCFSSKCACTWCRGAADRCSSDRTEGCIGKVISSIAAGTSIQSAYQVQDGIIWSP